MKMGAGRRWVREPPPSGGQVLQRPRIRAAHPKQTPLDIPMPTLRALSALPCWTVGFHIQLGVRRGKKGRGPQSKPLR